MRVLTIGNMYPPHSRGGYELAWRSAVEHLRAAGHEVRVLTTDFRLPERGDAPDDEPDVHRELRWYWRDDTFPALSVRERFALERHNAAALDRHIDEFKPDAVSWWAMGGMSLSLIERVRRAGIGATGTVGDGWLIYGPEVDAWSRMFRDRRLLGAVVERLTGIATRPRLAAAASWLFISETLGSASRNPPGLEQTEVSYPGIDHELFPAAPPMEWGWRLLYAGRVDPRKGIDVAVHALEHLPDAATLTIDGPGDAVAVEELKALVTDLGLAHRVLFTRTERERLGEAYAAADVVVFPVQWIEPLGLVPLEAMAVGTPVVATGRGGSGEYLRHEQNCLLFKPRDSPEALAAAVVRLADSEELRSRLRDGGLSTAARFGEQSFNDRVLAALERVAQRGPSA